MRPTSTRTSDRRSATSLAARRLVLAISAGVGAAAAALAVGGSPAEAAACDGGWTHRWNPDFSEGQFDDWHSPSNWDVPSGPRTAPGATSRVCLPSPVDGSPDPVVRSDTAVAEIDGPTEGVEVANSATLTINDSARLHHLQLQNGTLTGPGTTTLLRTLISSNGRISGHEVVMPVAELPVVSTSFLWLTDGAVLDVASDESLTGNNYLRIDDTSRLVLRGDVTADETLYIDSSDPTDPGDVQIMPGASLTYDNTGGSTHIQAGVLNAGTLSLTAGSLTLTGGGSAPSTGHFSATPGATLSLAANQQALPLGAGAQLTRTAITGRIDVVGPATVADGTFQSGEISGPGTLTVGGTLTWAGGSMNGAGTTLVPQGAEIVTSEFQFAWVSGNRLLDLRGTMTQAANSQLFVDHGAEIRIAGLLERTGGGYLGTNGQEPGRVTLLASGILRKSGDGSVTLDAPLDSVGSVQSVGGDLQLRVPGAAPLDGIVSASPGHSVTIAPQSGATWPLADGLALDGVTLQNRISVPTGTVTSARTTFASAQVSGPGTVLATGVGAAQSLQVLDTGHLVIPTGAELELDPFWQVQVDAGGRVDVAGDLRLQEAAYIGISEKGRLSIPGVATLGPDAQIGGWDGYGVVAVPPSGRIQSGAGDAPPTVGAVLDNDGTVEAGAAGLVVSPAPGDVLSTGTFRSGAGTLELHGPQGSTRLGDGALLDGVNVTGDISVDGNVSADGVRLDGTVRGSGNLVVAGTLDWRWGNLAGTATTLVPVGATLQVGEPGGFFGGTVGEGHSLVIRGTATVAGALYLEGGGSVDVRGTATMTDDAHISGDGVVVVTGTLQKLAGTGTATVSALVDNEGVVAAESGTLSVWRPMGFSSDGRLLGGRWHATATLELPLIQVNAADLVLQSTTASFGPGNEGLTWLTRNAANGRIDLRNGADLQVETSLTNRGVIELSPGSEVRGQGFAQDSTGELRVHVSAAGLGRVEVAALASLAGTLTLDRDPAYDPPPGTRLSLLSAGQRTGQFERVLGGTISASKALNPEYDVDGVDLVVGTPPAPQPVQAVATTAEGSALDVAWAPGDGSTSTEVVMREGTTAPRSPADGTVVYRGTGERFVARRLVPGRSYAFSLFARSASGVSDRTTLVRHGTRLALAPTGSLRWSGRVVDTVTGRRVDGGRVTIWRQDIRGAAWRRVRSVSVTDREFQVQLNWRPYRVRLVHGGATDHLGTRANFRP